MQMICTLATLMAKLVATRPFRFGVVSSDAATAEEWTAKARRAEELGYDVFLVPDHLSVPPSYERPDASRDRR